MGHNSDGSITISTLGDFREFGHSFQAYCDEYGCRRTLAVTLDDMIRIFGPDWPFTSRKPPIKCAECGSNRISYTVAPRNTTGRLEP